MKQDAAKMTLKKHLFVTAATMGIALVSTLVGAQADGTTETAAPPSPVLTDNTTKNNYPPTDFDPEKKSPAVQKGADSKQQHKWPNANQGTAQSNQYPPQTGIDLTPPAKPPVAKPDLKYPEFPKVAWPKGDKGNADQAWQEASKKAKAKYKAWQVEQEKVFKARQAALKKQWEAQQVELKQAREAHDADMKRREDEAKRIHSEREKAWASEDAALKKRIAEMDRQAEARRKAMEAEMFRQRQAMEAQMSKQREAMKAEMAIMNQRAKSAPVPPLPPKLSPPVNAKPAGKYATPQQVAPKQFVPQFQPQFQPQAQGARPFPGQAPQGNWGYQPNPQWQYQNRMPPPWGYNPYWQGANRPWPQAPYPYGQGYNQPR